MEKIFLYPSAIFVSQYPHEVTTILGSCVAVCLWDKSLRIGGINHFMLPVWNGQGLASPKYGNIAIMKLIEKLELFGSLRNDLVAKVFGGGEVIANQSAALHIGERNVIVAQEILKELRIPIGSMSVGGKLGRKIVFYTENGDVLHRFIKSNNS